MNKPKLYLDTSVISHLDQRDAPERMADTLELWEILKTGKYEVVTSVVTTDELAKNAPQKLLVLSGYFAEMFQDVLLITDEAQAIAEQLISLGILTERSIDDCRHIGAAIASKCDFIVSWNFKHMVRVKTIKGVRAITSLRGYPNIDIVQPTMLLEREE
jgi:predicted nucleic acid-binding protein